MDIAWSGTFGEEVMKVSLEVVVKVGVDDGNFGSRWMDRVMSPAMEGV